MISPPRFVVSWLTSGWKVWESRHQWDSMLQWLRQAEETSPPPAFGSVSNGRVVCVRSKPFPRKRGWDLKRNPNASSIHEILYYFSNIYLLHISLMSTMYSWRFFNYSPKYLKRKIVQSPPSLISQNKQPGIQWGEATLLSLLMLNAHFPWETMWGVHHWRAAVRAGVHQRNVQTGGQMGPTDKKTLNYKSKQSFKKCYCPGATFM